MKRLFQIVPIILLSILLFSCNVDGFEGIYARTVTASPSTQVNVIKYLGMNTSNEPVILTDSGLRIIKNNEAVPGSFEENPSKIIRSACLINGTDVYYSDEDSPEQIFTNGYALGQSSGLYQYKTGSTPETIDGSVVFVKAIESETAILVTTSDKIIIYDNSAKVGECDISGRNVLGFQKTSTGYVLVCIDSGETDYKLYTTTDGTSLTDSGKTLPNITRKSGSIVSARLGSDLIFKSDNYFEIIPEDLSTDAESKSDGWALSLKTAALTNMKVEKGECVISTNSNGIYSITSTSDTTVKTILH